MPDIFVRVDGVDYAYAPHWRWSLLERSRFGKLFNDMVELERKDVPTERDMKRYMELQISLCMMVAPSLPEEVARALPSDAQRLALIIDFLTKSGNQGTTLIPAPLAAMMSLMNQSNVRRIGDSSSPDSKPSTAATRQAGRRSLVRS